ncbi:hypothetical protein EVC20_127 [Rhizobium phage RHph_Y2_17_1]|nr:hypothetical protein EVC19_127 [Rhizobium phage RHph_Y2_11]QIG75866.1 hypothetical protein EVC20_127 [Rhizobium phage RHph_Y2_17_1]
MDSRLRMPRHTKECRLIIWSVIIGAYALYSIIMIGCVVLMP